MGKCGSAWVRVGTCVSGWVNGSGWYKSELMGK